MNREGRFFLITFVIRKNRLLLAEPPSKPKGEDGVSDIKLFHIGKDEVGINGKHSLKYTL
jgi:hypothetical protein